MLYRHRGRLEFQLLKPKQKLSPIDIEIRFLRHLRQHRARKWLYWLPRRSWTVRVSFPESRGPKVDLVTSWFTRELKVVRDSAMHHAEWIHGECVLKEERRGRGIYGINSLYSCTLRTDGLVKLTAMMWGFVKMFVCVILLIVSWSWWLCEEVFLDFWIPGGSDVV